MATKTTKGRLAKYPSTLLSFVLCAQGSSTAAATYSATTGSRGDFSIAVTEAITGWYDVLAYQSGTLRGVGAVYYATDTAGTYYVDDPTILTNIAVQTTAIEAQTDLIGTATIYPLTGTVAATASASYIAIKTNEAVTITVTVYDAAGATVSTVGMTLELVFESGSTEVVIANASITKTSTGFTFVVPSTLNAAEKLWTYVCRKTTDEGVLCSGKLEVIYAPNN